MNRKGLDYLNDKVESPQHPHADRPSKNITSYHSMLFEIEEVHWKGYRAVRHLAIGLHPRFWVDFILLFVLVLLNVVPTRAQEATESAHLAKFQFYQVEAELLYGQGMRLEAMDMIDSAIALVKKIWPNSEKEAEIYSVKGRVHANMGEYARSEKAYDHALQLYMKAGEDKYVETARSLNQMMLLQRTMGQYSKVIDNQTTHLALCKKYDPKNEQKILQCHVVIAEAYIELGRYEKADSFFMEANNLVIDYAISKDEEYASMQYKWAGLQQRLGQLERAENSYLNALKYLNSTAKNQKDLIVTIKVDLADMYLKYGRINDAQTYYTKAKKYIEKEGSWFKRRLPYSPVMLGIAKIYRQTGQFDKAVELYEVAMDIMENKLQQRYPEYARLEYELATLYHDFGYSKDAEEHYRNAIQIWERIAGSHLPYYPLAITRLGQLFRDIQLWEHAELQLVSARMHWENNMGYHSSHYIDNLIQLAEVYIQTAAYDRAKQVYVDASDHARKQLVQMVQFMSEQEMNQYMIKYVQAQDKMFSLLVHFPADSLLASTCFDNILFYKGFLLQAAINMKQTARRHPEGKELLDQLNATRRMISLAYSSPVPNNALLDTLTNIANQQERSIAKTVAGYEEAVQIVSWQDVKAQLKTHEAAIEFFWYRKNDSNYYAAFILTPQSLQPIFVPLFAESELFPLIKDDVSDKANYIHQLYAPEERKMIQLGTRPKSLFDLIWKPIENLELKGIRTFYYTPAGVIHWINVPAIAIDETKILSDKYQMIALSSTRHLVPRKQDIYTKESDEAIVVGGVNFDYTDKKDQKPKNASSTFSQDAAIRAAIQSNLPVFGSTWAFLFWTALESDSIRNILQNQGLKVTQLNGTEATEQRIKQAGLLETSPYLVHIATHGFFFPDSTHRTSKTIKEEPVFKWSDNPMIRSGLILAGGNYAWQHGGSILPEMEDGILTAYEISLMNLSNTELVVLSACETGLGDIQGNEGVYGLQRAFKIAGAKYLIMSLWQVPDRETMEFMTTFYKNWLEGEMTIPDAFRKTQQEMRDRFINPYSWAGFVLVE